jgi:hypothetical protein
MGTRLYRPGASLTLFASVQFPLRSSIIWLWQVPETAVLQKETKETKNFVSFTGRELR